MKYLLDTNTCSELMAGRPSAVRRVRKLPPAADLMTSVVVLGELLFGVRHAPAARRSFLDRTVRKFLDSLAGVVPVTRGAAGQYGLVKAHLAAQGTPIPSNDLWIASTALAEDMVLVSHDEHFSRVPGLTVEDWTR